MPVNERIPYFGELLFWFFLIFAAGSAILALAKPQAVTSLVRTAGIDIVILQDGSASMHVTDMKGDRWQRSMVFLRTFGEALRWENDRISSVPSEMMFTLPVGGWDNDGLDDARLPDDFVIDYVRVWQRDDLK